LKKVVFLGYSSSDLLTFSLLPSIPKNFHALVFMSEFLKATSPYFFCNMSVDPSVVMGYWLSRYRQKGPTSRKKGSISCSTAAFRKIRKFEN
jgi:hypothetical protein